MTPEQQLLFDTLTPLQQRMCTFAIENPKLSQRQAYLLAGGTAKTETAQDTSACEIMNNPQVKSFMDSIKGQAVSDAIMGREEAMQILTLMARGSLTDIVKFRTDHIGNNMETGDEIHQTSWVLDEDLQRNDPAKLTIIESLEVGKNGPKIKQHSKSAAIAQLAKMQGWESASKHEISGPGGGPILTKDVSEMSDEALMAVIAGQGVDAE